MVRIIKLKVYLIRPNSPGQIPDPTRMAQRFTNPDRTETIS